MHRKIKLPARKTKTDSINVLQNNDCKHNTIRIRMLDSTKRLVVVVGL
jgi:hypothetical protein